MNGFAVKVTAFFNLNKYTMTKKHKVLIPMELCQPRWHILKVNIEHGQHLLNCARAIGSFETTISDHKKAIFHKQEELKRYDYMWDAVMPTEERKLLIKTLNN